MARTTQVIDLPFITKIDKKAGHISLQLIQVLREAVQHGQLQSGDPLPSSRELAQTLRVARGTVIEAYDQLLAEGVLESRARAGTYVAHALNSSNKQQKLSRKNNVMTITTSARAFAEVLKDFKPLPHLPFAVSVPINRTQPNDTWRKFGNRFRARGEGIPTGYEDPQGILSLREAIADYVRRSRSVRCTPEQIIITTGTQQALYICSQILFEAQDQVWVEDPAYRGTTATLAHSIQKIQMVAVPVDAEGIQVERGIALAKSARAAFVTPSHQYPLGMSMSLARRNALLAWAKNQNAWIIEDDYDSELRYSGQPFPSLQGLDPSRVIYLGTFSKVLFPSLRLGYAIVPEVLVDAFCGLKALIDRHSASADQHVLAAFIREGYLERHIRRIRNVYAEKRKEQIAMIKQIIPTELAHLEPGDQGLHMVLWLADGINDLEIAASALRDGVAIKAISPTFTHDHKRSGLIIGLGDFETADMRIAIQKLSRLLAEAKAQSSSST